MDAKMIYKNYLGEAVSDNPEYASPEFGHYEDGFAITNWEENEVADPNGFDKRRVDPISGDYIAEVELPLGTRLCRYGLEKGRYTALVGTDYALLGLPWKKETVPYFEYEVVADGVLVTLCVIRGWTAPMFDSPGGAMQFQHKHAIEEEVEIYKTLRRIIPWQKEENKI